MRPYVGIFSLHIKHERLEQFMDALERVLPESAREPGLLSYQVFQDPAQPGQLVFVDFYRDRAAYDAHMASPHFARFAAEIGECFAEAPRSQFVELLYRGGPPGDAAVPLGASVGVKGGNL